MKLKKQLENILDKYLNFKFLPIAIFIFILSSINVNAITYVHFNRTITDTNTTSAVAFSQQFIANGSLVNQITLNLSAPTARTGNITLYLYSDSSNTIGSKLYTFSQPFDVSQLTVNSKWYQINDTTGYNSLTNGTAYWIVANLSGLSGSIQSRINSASSGLYCDNGVAQFPPAGYRTNYCYSGLYVGQVLNPIINVSLLTNNMTYSYSSSPIFNYSISGIIGTWNNTLIMNGTNSASQNGISTNGNYNFTFNNPIVGNEYLWWINSTDSTNISNSFISEKRLFYAAGTSSSNCVINIGGDYLVPDGCYSTY